MCPLQGDAVGRSCPQEKDGDRERGRILGIGTAGRHPPANGVVANLRGAFEHCSALVLPQPCGINDIGKRYAV